MRREGTPLTGTADDFGAFVLLGARIEAYPAPRHRIGKRFGIAAEITGFLGEADLETQPGSLSEEVTLAAAVIAPSLVARFPGPAWEGYAGAGVTIVWGAEISDVGGVALGDDDSDVEIPLRPSLYAGARRTAAAGWFLQIEARWQAGENDFTLGGPRTDIHVDWRLGQIAIGSGYRF